MNPIKPKYINSVKVDWKISKYSKQIVSLYAKYTKYDENEIVDKLILDILEDKNFVEWLNTRRYQKKIQELMLNSSDIIESDGQIILGGETIFEETQEDSEI